MDDKDCQIRCTFQRRGDNLRDSEATYSSLEKNICLFTYTIQKTTTTKTVQET